MGKMEKECREAVESVIQDITDFSKEITDIMKQLKSSVSELNDVWKDAQYTQFEDYIDELKSNIQLNLNELETAREDLRKKLIMYD